jgi:hypothetical protein
MTLSKRDKQALNLLSDKGISLFTTIKLSIVSNGPRVSKDLKLYKHFENLEKLGLAYINHNSGLVFKK